MSAPGLDVEGAQNDHDHVLSVRVSCRACGRKGDATVTHRSGTPIGDAIDDAESAAAHVLIHKPGCPIAVANNRPTAAGE